MHVRARTCCSIITSTGEFCDTRASSAGLEKSSMMSPNSEKGLSHSTSFDFHFPWSKYVPHTLQRIAPERDVLPTFKFVRGNDVREDLVPRNRSSCCKYCDTRSPPNSRPSTTCASSSVTRYRNGLAPVSSPDAFFLLTRPQMVLTDFPSVFCGWHRTRRTPGPPTWLQSWSSP